MQRKTTDFIVVHCSATKAAQVVTVETIDAWHRARGWSGCGYHRVIVQDGSVQVGRELDEVGAHVAGFNSRSVGICLVGGISPTGKPENTFTEQQMESLGSLLHVLLQRYPRAIILGHRDLSPDKNNDGQITRNEWLKDCPCFDVRAWWKSLSE
jgi:N-acetylmuramoyl-L-alanine amidase